MVLVFVFFWPILKNGFVWDDEFNLVNNPHFRGLAWTQVTWMFSNFHDGNYHPLCWLSLGLDFKLWGMHPAGYHLTDLILHGLNAFLFYRVEVAILRYRSANPAVEDTAIQTGAALGALFFALHPLRVESVAWISTRGDTLCGVFYFLTLLTYFRIDAGPKSKVKNRWFWLSLLFFTCSLLSRAWGITLPVILLILDVYPLGRLQLRLGAFLETDGRRILMEKMPFALLALSFSILALLAKQGSMVAVVQHGVLERALQSFYGLCFYIGKTLVPRDLSPLYQLHAFNDADPTYTLCTLAILGVTGGLICCRRRWPWALTTWCCYIIIISPLLGIVQSGPQLVADRYTYFACLPFAVLIAAGMKQLWLLGGKGWLTGLIGAAAFLFLLGIASYRQAGVWRDNLSFWDRVIALDSRNEIAVNMRARLKFEEIGDFSGAVTDYSHALRLNPGNGDALVNRGLVRLRLEMYRGAAADFNAAQRLAKDQPEVYNGRGLLYYQQGQLEKALQQYNIAVSLAPNFVDAHNNRGLLQKALGNIEAALENFDMAIHLAPEAPEAYVNRGDIKQAQGQMDQAAFDFETALKLAPANWPFRLQVEQRLQRIYTLRPQGLGAS